MKLELNFHEKVLLELILTEYVAEAEDFNTNAKNLLQKIEKIKKED